MADSGFSRMVIASQTTEIAPVEQAILEAAESRGYPQRDIFAIRLALEEALSNAIHHGNADDPAKQVTIDYRVTDDHVTIEVGDDGRGFHPGQLADPREEINLRHPRGRGVLLMRSYMNEVNFNSAGNVVTLIKRRGEPVED